MHTWLSLCTGGGVAEARLNEINVQPRFGLELNPAIASVYRANYGDHVAIADMTTFAMEQLPDVDIHWYSPECKEFSSAKTDGVEGPLQLAQADACCRAIRAKRPRFVFVENVLGYLKSESLKRIRAALNACGYVSTVDVVNSADYGVPQTRKRLIVRAIRRDVRTIIPALQPTHRKGGDMFCLPWVGWYAAIKDLVDDLPDSRFANWQIPLLPADVRTMLFGSERNGENRDHLNQSGPDAPAFTVTAANGRKLRAFVCDGQANSDGAAMTLRTASASAGKRPARALLMRDDNAGQEWGKQYRDENEPAYSAPCRSTEMQPRYEDAPAYTILADQRQHVKAYTAQGRIVKITPRPLARFQSLPDTYWLPDTATLAGTVIGNGAPSEMVKRIVGTTIGAI